MPSFVCDSDEVDDYRDYLEGVPVDETIERTKGYVGRYSAPGYLDCTPWSGGTNKRKLARELRDLYEAGE